MRAQYFCQFKGRVSALRNAPLGSPGNLLNGIEYLEVTPPQTQLKVHFVHDLDVTPTPKLTASNIEIRGGVRVRDPKVKGITWTNRVLTVEVETPGDFSRYVLRLVGSAASDQPPVGIDPALAQVEFNFKVDCPSDFDCRETLVCAPEQVAEPLIDYLARDYTSFRRLMLDRISTLLPDWRERSPADLWVTLVEALAFRADELSYFQDAVATEAYLGTARKRISVRRHARLLDYPFHDGCNARVWVAFETGAEGLKLSGCDPDTGVGGTQLLTQISGQRRGPIAVDQAQAALDAGEAQAFELLQEITLHTAHNRIEFYTWSDEECCLPKGATRAFLRDSTADPLKLRAGDVLIFEEQLSTITGEEPDVDRAHRHAVRLTRATSATDPLLSIPYVEIEWAVQDALPFPLCISKRIDGALVSNIAVALGNVTLADHGRTVPPDTSREELPATFHALRFRPLLQRTALTPLTQQAHVREPGTENLVLMDNAAPAAATFATELSDVSPAIELISGAERWTAQRDLLASGRFATDFVVETEDDGRSYIRFGDDANGQAPDEGDLFFARYRIGNGTVGNVGPEAIAHIVGNSGVDGVRNPLAARGGIDPHPIQQAKLYAPQAFRRQERAVTAADYAVVVERHPEVQRAVATRRWTGSWYTMFISVDRRSGEAIDEAFEAELVRFIERYRLAGHDIEIDGPRFVPLDIVFDVCAKAGYYPSDVQRRLLEAFSAGVLPAGGKGLFHPDNFSFGDPVYLSALIARAMAVPGVFFVSPHRFQRWGGTAAGEIDEGVLPIGRLEIARLDNNPNEPENGHLEFRLHGEA